jgi:hypothetical protein
MPSPKSRRPGPWSLRDITDDAREAARRCARAKGVSIGAWVNQAILDQARQQEDRQLPVRQAIRPEHEIGPFWRWMRRRLGIQDGDDAGPEDRE